MLLLAKYRKVELVHLAEDLGVQITPVDKVFDICSKIKASPNFDEAFARDRLVMVEQQREEERIQMRLEWANELEKLRLMAQRKKIATRNLNADLKTVTTGAQLEGSFPIQCISGDKPATMEKTVSPKLTVSRQVSENAVEICPRGAQQEESSQTLRLRGDKTVIGSKEEVNADNTSADVTVVRGSQREGGILTTCLGNEETGEDFKRNPEIPTKEVICPVEVSYQVHRGNETIGLVSRGESVEMVDEEIVSFDYASKAAKGGADAKSEVIQHVNQDSVKFSIIESGGEEVNIDFILENPFPAEKGENLNEFREESSGVFNVESIPLEIKSDCRNEVYQRMDSNCNFGNAISWVETDIVRVISSENLVNLAGAEIDQRIDNFAVIAAVHEELDVNGESVTHDKCKKSNTNVKIACRNRKFYRGKSNYLLSTLLRWKRYQIVYERYLSFGIRKQINSNISFRINKALLSEYFLDPGEKI